MNIALVQNSQNHINRRQGSQDQDRFVFQRRLERIGSPSECAVDCTRHLNLVNRLPNRKHRIGATASALRKRRHRPEDFLHTQWSFGALGLSVWKSPGIRGGLRCSRQMVMPGGCVPHVRDGLDRWRGWLCSRAARSAGCGKCFTLLFVAGGRGRAGSLKP